MRTSYGYDTYRGRTRTQKILTAIIVLLLLVLLLAVALFFLFQRHMVYSDDGKAHLDLPFFQSVATPEPSQGQDLVVVTAPPTPEPTPTPEPALQVVSLLRASLTDGTAAQQVEAAGGNAVMFNMKADDGTLGYVSALPQAASMKTSASDPGLNDAIQAVTGSDLYTIARVSCFRDNISPRMNNSLAIKTNSGYNWRDSGDIRWMNVSVPGAQEYVAGVCRELAQLGFDEILLENSCYPVSGHLEYIRKGDAYDVENLSLPVEQFYEAVHQALADFPQVKLSIAVSADVMTDSPEDRSGQTPALLAKYAHHLFLPAPENPGDYDRALGEMELSPTQLVFTTASAAPSEAGWLLPSDR